MKKMLIMIFATLLLLGCSSETSGVNNKMFNDGEDIVRMTVENVNAGKLDFSDSQKMKIDNFTAKYMSDSYERSKTESEFYFDVFDVYVNYMSYGTEQETEYMDKYYEALDVIKTNYNIKVD